MLELKRKEIRLIRDTMQKHAKNTIEAIANGSFEGSDLDEALEHHRQSISIRDTLNIFLANNQDTMILRVRGK